MDEDVEGKEKELLAAVTLLLQDRSPSEVDAVAMRIASMTNGMYLSQTIVVRLRDTLRMACSEARSIFGVMDGQSPLGAAAQATNRTSLDMIIRNLERTISEIRQY